MISSTANHPGPLLAEPALVDVAIRTLRHPLARSRRRAAVDATMTSRRTAAAATEAAEKPPFGASGVRRLAHRCRNRSGMNDASPANSRADDMRLLSDALAGERAPLKALLDRLTPIVQARVARCLLRSGHARDVRRDVEDFTQDALVELFANGAHALHGWREDAGLSLDNYVGLITERRTISALRSARRNPWREQQADEETVDAVDTGPDLERRVDAGDLLDRMLTRLRETLTPLGFRLFELLYVQELDTPQVCAATALSPQAVYAWRSRLRRAARQVRAELMSDSSPPPRTPAQDGPRTP